MRGRAEFGKATKLAAWTACKGHCQACTAKLSPGNTEYHHDVECTYGGTAELKNCIVLCKACHRYITRTRTAQIAKSNRMRAKHIGIKRQSSFQTNRDSTWKKKMDGSVVRRCQ